MRASLFAKATAATLLWTRVVSWASHALSPEDCFALCCRTARAHLRRTTPPTTEIVDFLLHRFSQNRLLCAIQVYEVVLPVSMAELRARFDWSTRRIYELNMPGQNHGILLGTKGWAP